MQRAVTYVLNQQLFPDEVNVIVDRALGGGAATSNNVHDTLGDGMDVIEWMYDAATLGIGALIKVDGQRDYRDRLLAVTYNTPGSPDQEPGSANDFLLDYTPLRRRGYTGLGGLDAASAVPTTGNPPVPAAGTSWALQIDTSIWIYASTVNGSLYLFNGTAGTLRSPILTIYASATTGKRTPP